jgi:photosystem II stability/assembly factor-like uncharacterized protein
MILAAVAVVMLQVSCTSVVEPGNRDWEFLGFEDKFALRLVLGEPYLYVCAGSDGVWRRDVRRLGDWQYLGLRDTSLGKRTHVGSVDIDVLSEDILVAYRRSAPGIHPESTVAIWRSIDGGRSWFRSDSGIPETITDPYEYNTMSSLQRSPNNPDIIIGVIGPAVYRSTNGGNFWRLIKGRRGAAANMDYVRWNPYRRGQVWFFGETSVFAPYMFHSNDYGETFEGSVNFNALGFPSDAAVVDVAFDASNPDIVYAATSYGVIKTTDGGDRWTNNAITLTDKGFVFRMAHHPSQAGLLYVAGGRRVYVTRNGESSAELLGEIERGFITSLVFDTRENQLFVGTTDGGIYALKLKGR